MNYRMEYNIDPANDTASFLEISHQGGILQSGIMMNRRLKGQSSSVPLWTFDLLEGNLFVMRLNNYDEITSVEQIKETLAKDDPQEVLAVFKRLLPNRAELQALQYTGRHLEY